jgi:hypothetical protein
MTAATIAVADDLLADGTVTVAGATREFGVGRTRLYDLMQAGTLPYSRAIGRRLIPRAALKRLIAAGMVGAETAAGGK